MLKPGDPGYMEEDNGPTLYILTFSFLAAATLVVLLRLFCRWILLRARHTTLSENIIIVSLLIDVASCILIHYQIQTGMGRHIEYSRARPPMLVNNIKVGIAQNACYQALNGLVKLSILAQFHQLAPPGVQKRVVVWISVFVSLFTLFTVFAAIFQCIPMHVAWHLETYPKGCWNMMGVNFFTSSVTTLMDIVIFVLPVPTILNLQVTLKKKITLVGAYGLGLLAIACSIVRLRNIVHFNGEGDFTYVACMVPIWGAIEVNAGIICASLPFILPVIRWMSGSTVGASASEPRRKSTSAAHELRRIDKKSWQLNSGRPSDWQPMPSDSTENMVIDNSFAFGFPEAKSEAGKQIIEECELHGDDQSSAPSSTPHVRRDV